MCESLLIRSSMPVCRHSIVHLHPPLPATQPTERHVGLSPSTLILNLCLFGCTVAVSFATIVSLSPITRSIGSVRLLSFTMQTSPNCSLHRSTRFTSQLVGFLRSSKHMLILSLDVAAFLNLNLLRLRSILFPMYLSERSCWFSDPCVV